MRERKQAVEFTRSRPYHSDDNAHVEQKNWTWARQLLGYGRLEDPALVGPISALYREVWAPWQNFFLPCFKLQAKWRQGSHWRKRYELPSELTQIKRHPGNETEGRQRGHLVSLSSERAFGFSPNAFDPTRSALSPRIDAARTRKIRAFGISRIFPLGTNP